MMCTLCLMELQMCKTQYFIVPCSWQEM